MVWTRLGAVAAAIAAAFVLTGAGQVSPATSGPENAAAARAVAVLTGRAAGDVPAVIPADFADVMGYEPVTVTDAGGAVRVLDPSGECSSPVGTAGYDFAQACRVHDFGYDLLRYAVERGGELGPWARMAIDDQFGAMLRARCDSDGGGAPCHAAAALTLGAVKMNSWRQGYGQPGDEDPVPYIVAGLLLVSACVGPPLVRRLWGLG
ncbi:phospholipase A2-like protein [Haloactinopolyspora alba]|uniref:Phospholipase A2-like protein n=1 Tax=Haloactinopolyspora alba TaxID=648780 RepID=A0A2P8E2R2_9ACTN|nr:phospholipase A2 [Haloactinopolyspora alba]PSL03736.1 phospholipase A2-like protein [Haloactinopolyspora alba]